MVEPAAPNAPARKVWDLPVRITHWLLVVGIAGSYLTSELGIEYFQYHLWFGYAVVVLVVFRILWGFVGTRHARFASFIRGPAATWRYARETLRGRSPSTPGHNPLGAWMVLLLLAALLAQGLTGLFANDEIFNTGPLYGYISDEFSLVLTSWHRRLFDWILIAVALHVLAVLGHKWIAGHDLVAPMFSGRKPANLVPDGEAISSSRSWLAVLLVAVLVASISWLVAQAPELAITGFD